MPRQRSNELELNFDGLTDSVTNLVGALILLVVLVIGVTKEAVSQQDAARKPKSPAKKAAGEKSVRPLQDRVNQLKAQIDGVDKQADQLKAELKRISTQVDNLLDKVRKVQAPKAKPVPPKKDVVKTVPFRPPFEKLSFKKPNVAFVCENKRVSIVDLADWNKNGIASLVATVKAKALTSGHVVRLASGDYDVRIPKVVTKSVPGVGLVAVPAGMELVRKSGHEGETAETIQKADSRFQHALRTANPTAEMFQFPVYPDSYDAFRIARRLAWDRKFELGWTPMLAGDAVSLGGGGARVQ